MTISLYANAQEPQKEMSPSKIKKMDRQLTKHKAQKRNFKSTKEFKRKSNRRSAKRLNRYSNNDDRGYNSRNFENNYNQIRQRGHRYTKRGWILAYRHDRASFYDNEGYYYGFFNRDGYYFEDIFYRYDRNYTFRDRVKGKGLFSNRYYMPADYKYYGFAKSSRRSPRDYRRW